MPAARPEFLVFAAQRNEGPFLVEWLAWYRALGFAALVAYNDCTDRSPELLAALARAGWVEAVEHRPRPPQTPKRSAYRVAERHPGLRAAAWLLVCDIDEFLVPHRGDGTVAGYLATLPGRPRGVALHWQCFGNAGHALWEDGLVHRQFTRTGPSRRQVNAFVKTLMREPGRFRRLSDHAPVGFDGAFGRGEEVFVDSLGRPLPEFGDLSAPVRFTPPGRIEHGGAQINHYILRADESWALKRGTPSASAGKDRYTDAFHRARNANGWRDLSALALAPRFEAAHAEAMALPGVRRLHHLCCLDYLERLCRHQGRDPAADPRWHHHQAAAARG